MFWTLCSSNSYKQRSCEARIEMIAQDIIQQLTLRAKAGRSPKRNTAQGNTLGERSLAHWRAVSAKGASEISFLATSFCAYSAPVCWNIHTQGVTLDYIPIGLSARLCGLKTLHT